MSSADEYVFRLGLDYRELRTAVNSILTLMGRVDDQFGGKTPKHIRQVERSLGGLLRTVNQVNGKSIAPKDGGAKSVAAIRAQKKQVEDLTLAYRNAAEGYAKFQRNTARGLARPGGTQPARFSNRRLGELQQQDTALRANGVSRTPAERALAAAVRQEQAARRAAAAQRRQDDAAAQRALLQQEKAARALAKALEAEERAARRANAAMRAGAARDTSKAEREGTRKARERLRLEDQLTAGAKRFQVEQERERANEERLAAAAAKANAQFRRREQRRVDNGAKEQTRALRERLRLEDQINAASARFAQAEQRKQQALARTNAQIRQAYERELPRLRYALYDVSTASALVGAGLVAGGVAVLKTAADFQYAYASVRRTSDLLTNSDLTATQRESQFSLLRRDLVDLSTQIPVTFADVTKIATLGNQLGIPTTAITNFTKTVAQFSSTTGVSAEESATAFGRLGQILGDQDYKKIGDEIAYLGVRSVATEQEIINTATQLAVSGQGIKLTTENVLALSTSVASLGVKPEQARGTFIRAFGAIGAAVATGGAKLNDVARIAGKTSDEFRNAFNKGGDSAYGAFLDFTRGLGTSTAQINGNLQSINITAVRDRQTLGLLAQNGSRALKDIENAAKGADNNFLDKAYGEQAVTVTAKLQVLGNRVLAFFDQVGQASTGPLAGLFDFLSGVLGFFTDIAASPVEGAFLAAAAGIAVLTGAGLLAVSMAGRFAANLIALQQLIATNVSGGSGLTAVWRAMTGQAAVLAVQTGQLTAAQVALAQSNGLLTASSAGAAAGGARVAATGSRLSRVTGNLAGAIGKAGLVGAVLSLLLVLPALAEGIKGIVNDVTGATPEIEDLTKAVQSLDKAGADRAKSTLTKGTQAFGVKPTDANGGTAQTYTVNGFTYTAPRTSGTTAISGGKAAVNRALTGQDTLKGQTLAGGADVDTATKELQNYDAAISQLISSGDQANANRLLGIYRKAMADAGVSSADAEKALTRTREALGATGDQSLAAATKQKALNDTVGEGTDGLDAYSAALDGIFDGQIAANKVTDDLRSLGEETVKSGALVAFGGDQMKTAIADIYGSTSDTTVVKGRLQSLYDQLIDLGYAKDALFGLAQAIGNIPGEAAKATVNMSGFTAGIADARKEADGAQASIRTMLDYAGDLNTAFSRAFDLRFGGQNATDTLTSGFRDLRDSIKDSREELRKARADLAELTADQTVRKYQLGIATQFGDTERAAVLRADIQKGESDIASKRGDIRDAQTAGSRALTGNSDAAIANRERFQGLIQNGQAVLNTAAQNGASPKELAATADRLKKQLIDQGAQMGFRKQDLVDLSRAYDDYTKVIGAIPRDVTTSVAANTSPASQAIAEYRSKLEDLDGKTVTTRVVQQAIDLADTGTDVAQVTQVKAQRSQAETDARAKKQRQLGLRSGGYTGALPRWQEAGTVHGDEFVLNSQAYRMFPRQMLEGANHGIAPVIPKISTTATLGPGATVGLSRAAERALVAGGGGSLTVRSDRIGSAMDQAFTAADRRGSN